MTYLQGGVLGYTATNVNLLNNTAVKVFTTSSGGLIFQPLFVSVVITAASGITLASSVNFGTNATSYNNIYSALSLATTVNAISQNAVSNAIAIPSSTDIYVKVGSLGLGTTYTGDVTVFGVYKG